MITEEQYNELLTKMDKFYEWAKKINQRVTQLEATHTGPISNLPNSTLWTEEEVEYLTSKLKSTNANRSVLRPKILDLEQEWQSRFGHRRSYDSIRKKWNRLNAS